MARINSLSDFLNDVSSAIKQKLGDDKPIPASQFDTKIAEIETKGNYQQKSVTISNNGTRIFTPDANYDAIEQIEITTNIPTPQLQTKAIEITSNGNISILPDTNYDGMTQVNLTINVPQESGSGGGNLPSVNAGEYEYVKTFTMNDNDKSTDGYIPMVDVYSKDNDIILIIRNLSSTDSLHVWYEGEEDYDITIPPQSKSEYLYESDEPASNVDITYMHNVSSFNWIKPT